MLKFFKKLRIFLFGRKTEIQYVEAALRRYQSELDNMESNFDQRRDCCQTCKYGSRYIALVEKIVRVKTQLHRLKDLRDKKIRDANKRRKWEY